VYCSSVAAIPRLFAIDIIAFFCREMFGVQLTSLMNQTLAAATKDAQTVSRDSTPNLSLLDGMKTRSSNLHVDERGSLFEIYSSAWGFDEIPIDHLYAVTIRPKVVKGWALHKRHEDRYFLLSGEMQIVLFDVRPNSSTCGQILKVTLSDKKRQLITIPANVWHADHNVGEVDALLLNLPTEPYNHADPDKYRLPIDTQLIPHDFENAQGW
jgi:dTDP-4-dehydrorhamnose 3,5-epimerase